MMDAIERSIVGPQIEIAIDRALGRQILRDGAPLATGRENIHQAVHDIANVDPALPAAPSSGWNQRFDVRPFVIRHVTRIAQFATIVTRTIFIRPHQRPPQESGSLTESQTIHPIQLLFGPTLSDRGPRGLIVSQFLFERFKK